MGFVDCRSLLPWVVEDVRWMESLSRSRHLGGLRFVVIGSTLHSEISSSGWIGGSSCPFLQSMGSKCWSVAINVSEVMNSTFSCWCRRNHHLYHAGRRRFFSMGPNNSQVFGTYERFFLSTDNHFKVLRVLLYRLHIASSCSGDLPCRTSRLLEIYG